MSLSMWALVGAVSLAIASQLVKRGRLQTISNLSDEEFVSLYERQFVGDKSDILRERRFIAKTLGLQYLKLRPDHRFSELLRLTGFLTEYHVGVSDLEAELLERCQRAGLARPAEFPATVGELISKLLGAKQKLEETSPPH